jgi:hypothetical protein
LRQRHPVLALGDFQALYASPEGGHLYAFRRDLAGESAIVLFNVGHDAVTINLPVGADREGRLYTNHWGSGEYTVQGGKLKRVHVPARGAAVLIG